MGKTRKTDRNSAFLIETLRAHALAFEQPLSPVYGNRVGRRVLIAFLAVAGGVFYALRLAFDMLDLRGTPGTKLAFVVLLIVAFFSVQRWYVRTAISDVGLRRFAQWTRRERLYFFQVVLLASVGFAFVFRDHLAPLLESRGVAGFALFSVATGVIWGMAQEFLYRGWLQTELTRRFGALVGLLAANVLFTFGPLHLDYLTNPEGVNWAGLGAVFGIGLLFGILYRRSGNLWIPAVLHGLWPLNMT